MIYNSINNIESNIDDDKKVLKLLYIDDLIKIIITEIENNKTENLFVPITNTHSISIGDLYNKILNIKFCRINGYLPPIKESFDKQLYSTYLSYITQENSGIECKISEDARGKFIEFVKSEGADQISAITILPNRFRGGHYHNTKTERFLLISGIIEFKF
jgi:UDP-2-acetamido-2,6-beta-L-arabino-hexul-4-ose reductase